MLETQVVKLMAAIIYANTDMDSTKAVAMAYRLAHNVDVTFEVGKAFSDQVLKEDKAG